LFTRKSIGYFLAVTSWGVWALMFAVPFVPWSAAGKLALGTSIYGFAQVLWVLALGLLGKEFIQYIQKSYTRLLVWFKAVSQKF